MEFEIKLKESFPKFGVYRDGVYKARYNGIGHVCIALPNGKRLNIKNCEWVRV